MFPKIKKKISSFIKDEKGTISKKNLISGAILLSGIGAFAKNVKAAYYPPANLKKTQLANLASGSKDWECTESIEDITGTIGFVRVHNCHASGSKSGCSRPQKHTNNMSGLHRNTDENFHRNIPNIVYDKTDKKIVTSHNHHGQHSNASVECEASGTTHCSY